MKKTHEHRGGKKNPKKQNQRKKHTWAGKKPLLPKSPEVTSKGEGSTKHF